MPSKALVTTGFLVLLLGLGIADAVLVETIPAIAIPTGTDTVEDPTTSDPGTQVRKAQGPDVLETFVTLQFTFQETQEQSILERVVTQNSSNVPVEKRVILRNGDRSAFVAWVDTPQVKTLFLSLKEALHRSFTAAVTDLLDEAQRREGKPTRNLLTFKDTGLLPERVVIVRVRERMYEFHIPEGEDDQIFDLIEELTK